MFEQTIEILIDEAMIGGFKILRFFDGCSDILINNLKRDRITRICN